jgi:hypothetical protein
MATSNLKDHFPNDSNARPFGPALSWYTVTPHATDELPARPIYLKCTVAGNLRMIARDGSDVTIPVVVGEVIDARPVRIHTDTTATIVAFW